MIENFVNSDATAQYDVNRNMARAAKMAFSKGVINGNERAFLFE